MENIAIFKISLLSWICFKNVYLEADFLLIDFQWINEENLLISL